MVFPKTTGPFEVGCIDLLTKAESIPKDFHPQTLLDSKLGSFVRLFYPCNNKADQYEQAKWLPEPFQKMYAYGYTKLFPGSSVLGWMYYRLTRNYTLEGFQNAPLIDQEEWKTKQTQEKLKSKTKLPVIVFSHGILSSRNTYSTFCTQLASEGNVVVAIEHRDASMAATFICDENSRVIEIPQYSLKKDEVEMKVRNLQLQLRMRDVKDAINLLEQVVKDPSAITDLVDTSQLEGTCSSSGESSRKVLESLKDRLDMDSLIMMGHSFGGTTTVSAMREDSRLLCGVSLDTWFEPLDEEFYDAKSEDEDKPVLLLFTEYFNFKDNVTLLNRFRDRYKKAESAEVVTLKEAIHFDQSDIPAIIPRLLKSVFDNSRGPRIDYNVAIKVQRNLIGDYINNFRQEPSEPLFRDGYHLDDHFILGTYNVLGEEKTGDEVPINDKNQDAEEEKVDEDS